MSTDTKATETIVETIATQQETVTPTITEEVDYVAKLSEVNARLAKSDEKVENYRKAYLKVAKGQPDEDDTSSNGEENVDSKVKRLVQEELLKTEKAQAQADKDKLIVAMAKKTTELTLALKNRGQVTSTSAAGSNEDRPEVKVEKTLSTEQLNALKKKGFTDKMIEEFKKNLNRVNEMPK